MPMRITNSIMHNNSKNNLNVNKVLEDRLNTQIATGQKISRPSDDPVVAIRALRLNSNIDEINQYYDKNIPDAEAWMTITETALTQTNTILEKIKESLTQGASDDNTAEDRMNILEDLKGMRDQIYSSGNADYAGRTVFTGYRTGESLTFKEQETNRYTIKEEFSLKDIDKITYVSGDFDIEKDKTAMSSGTGRVEQDIDSSDVYRIRLSYDNLMKEQKDQDNKDLTLAIKVTDKDDNEKTGVSPISVTVKSLTGKASTDDEFYTKVPDDEAYLIADTGELILGKNVRDSLQNLDTTDIISFEYSKESWLKNDLRPEHYFQCTDGEKIDYNKADAQGNEYKHFVNQNINYEISFNQTININTHASDVFTHDICRDVDELIAATQAVVDADNKITELTRMKSDPQYAGQIDYIDDMLSAAEKQKDMLSDKMQKMFSAGLTSFDGYLYQNNLAIAHIGSMRGRLELTKERVGEQLTSFKTLADDNININLTDTAIDLSNAELALQAAQLAASKIAQQTLLNYL